MKLRIFAIVMVLVMIFAAGCGTAKNEPEPAEEPVANMVNPFTDYESLEEAEKAAGFDINLPEAVDDADTTVYRVMKHGSDVFIEVIYAGGDTELLRVRKGLGTDPIDGDYEEYPVTVSADYGNAKAVTLRGEENSFHVATWTQNVGGTDYTYSVTCPTGFDKALAESLVSAVAD